MRLTPGQSCWLGAAAIGSIAALALSLFLQSLELSKSRQQWTNKDSLPKKNSHFFIVQVHERQRILKHCAWVDAWLVNASSLIVFSHAHRRAAIQVDKNREKI